MRVGRWITSALCLTAVLACVNALEETEDFEDPSEYSNIRVIPEAILHPHQQRGKFARLVESDICGAPCRQFYPAERPHCVHPPPTDKGDIPDSEDGCLCGLGLGDHIFHKDCTCVTPPKTVYQPVVRKLVDELLVNAALKKAFDDAIDELRQQDVKTATCITSTTAFLSYADQILMTPPYQSGNTRNVYNTLSTFYLVFNQSSLQPYQSPIVPGTTVCGTTQQQLSFISEWLREYAIAWGTYLDTNHSATCVETFKTDVLFCWNDFIVPEGGYRTFNEYFSRHLKPGVRPINCTCEPKAVVFPADSTFVSSYDISSTSEIDTGNPNEIINVKGALWSIQELLFLSHYRDCFAGGKFTHSFLSTYNYHRWHSPVSGKIVERRVIAGQFYLNVTITGNETVMPYAEDYAGYHFVQQRGLITIEADDPDIGYVVAMPVGMAQVAGISFTVKVGDHVHKGDELGTFLFGGSDFVVVFQKKADFHLMANLNRQSYMGELYGWIGPPPSQHPECSLPTTPPQTIDDCIEPRAESKATEFDSEAFVDMGDSPNHKKKAKRTEEAEDVQICPILHQCDVEYARSGFAVDETASMVET